VQKHGRTGRYITEIHQSICNKIQSFLDTYESLTKDKKKNNEDEIEEENDALLEEHVSLASTMMGNQHWTTNLTLLLHLGRRLSSMSQQMITTQELPDLEEVAEAIDSLQRISRFVESLNLELDPGFVIGDVTIGVARTLVSLGDEKSQRYGAEWLSKIEKYVKKFGDDGLQKVVATLTVAWKKPDRKRDSNAAEYDGDMKKKAKLF
jgi:uncharacterized protein with von Willebrand factor type A (vWA) domain